MQGKHVVDEEEEQPGLVSIIPELVVDKRRFSVTFNDLVGFVREIYELCMRNSDDIKECINMENMLRKASKIALAFQSEAILGIYKVD